MHVALFEMKQAHLSAVRFAMRETSVVQLTPARFDMLRTILEYPGEVLQSALHRLLGVSNAVVSIMVRALEHRGFVTRTRCRNDRRTFVVALTGKAKHALREVFFTAETEGYLDLALVSAFVKEHVERRGWHITVNRLVDRLRMFRNAFGRGRTSYNPWEWNDDDESFYFADVPSNLNRFHLPLEDDDDG